MSFRRRSVIIASSARFFSLRSNSRPLIRSCSGVSPRGRVPLIGLVSTVSPLTRRNRSGEELMIWKGPGLR